MEHNFFYYIDKPYNTNTGVNVSEILNKVYKYCIIFPGEKQFKVSQYSLSHSLLARLVLDYEPSENEHQLITNLRNNKNKIVAFANNENQKEIKIKNCNIEYQRYYREMMRHILVSMNDLPKNIDVNSICKINEDLTYIVRKK